MNEPSKNVLESAAEPSLIEPLQKAVNLAGGQSQLAKKIGVKQQHVWNWIHRDKKAAAEHARAIESAVEGQVTRYELRPDVFGAPPPSGGAAAGTAAAA